MEDAELKEYVEARGKEVRDDRAAEREAAREAAEREAAREAVERETARQAAEREAGRNYELELRRLEVHAHRGQHLATESGFSVAKNFRLVPMCSEKGV